MDQDLEIFIDRNTFMTCMMRSEMSIYLVCNKDNSFHSRFETHLILFVSLYKVIIGFVFHSPLSTKLKRYPTST